MARHYSTREFFRQVPNALLKRYFDAKGVLAGFNFAAMTEAKIDFLFDAWKVLPDTQRNAMDVEFRDIFEMGCEKGFCAIRDEALWQFEQGTDPNAYSAFVDQLSALTNHFERAMVTFLDHPTFWIGATRFHHADTLPYWRKRKNLGNPVAAVDSASLAQLAGLISGYFHNTEGRGKNCVVEPFRRGTRDYFFAYPEDYSQNSPEWGSAGFAIRRHNPAFEVIFVYSQTEGSLDLNYRGSKKAAEPLQAMFTTAILKLPVLPPDPKDQRIYDLAPLMQRSFAFTYDLASGIDKVAVKKLRLSARFKKGERINLEADTTTNANAVYDLLDRVGPSLPLHQYNVSQVELAVTMAAQGEKPAKTVTVSVSFPNSCSLKYDALDLNLRKMLSDSGIEPMEPTEPTEPTEPDAAPSA
jgi:hypothetical protein